MIQWIKRLLFKRDYEELQASIDFFNNHKANSYKILDEEKFDFNEKKNKWEKEEKAKCRASLEKENLQLIQDYKDKLETLIDYRLIPGAKVWVFNFKIHGKPEQIEIESVYINKEKISINNDWNYGYKISINDINLLKKKEKSI